MKKKELLQIKKQYATPSMMSSAERDELKRRKEYYYYSDGKGYRFGMYIRCYLHRDILKVTFFLPELMKAGGKLPAYELFIDKKNEDFITYDCLKKRWLTAKLDMIPWPWYVHNSADKWISEKDYMLIKRYLQTKQGGYAGVFEYQLYVRAEQLKRKHKRETDPWDLELEQTPKIPADWEQWVSKTGIPHYYMFYQYERRGAKTGYCSYCEKEVPIKEPRHNKTGKCSCCHNEVTFKAIGRMGTFDTPTVDMYLIQQCDTGFMVRNFRGSARYYKNEYKNPHFSNWEIRRALFDHNAKPISAYYWGIYKQQKARWMKGSVCGTSGWGRDTGVVYTKTLPALYKKELLATGFSEMMKCAKEIDPERYLAVWRNVPQIEQMLKADIPVLVNECMRDSDKYQLFFGRTTETSLIKAMGIDAPMMKRLRDSGRGLDYLRWLRYEKSRGKPIGDPILYWFCDQKIEPHKLSFIDSKMSIVQIYNYIRRQMEENKESSRWVLTTWQDYLSMAKRLKMDTDDEIIYRVRKLKQRHQELVDRCNEMAEELRLQETEAKYPHVKEVYASIQDLFAYKSRGYMIVVPTGILDIMHEGNNLHHCVGSSERYLDRIERRESYVLFLRRTRDPSKSYYTLEVEPDGTVRQKRTMYDRQEKDIEKATDFLKEWQGVVSKRLTADDRELAAASRELREKEFLQLKESGTRVWTAGFNGRPLLEILLEDLMENMEATAEPVLAAAA